MRRLTPEASLLKACTDLLSAERIWFRRWNTGAVKTEGRFFRFGQKGDADLMASIRIDSCGCGGNICPGKAADPQLLWIECKSPSGRQTNAQELFETEVKREGHHYLLVRDVDELRKWLTEHGAIGGGR